MKDPNAIFVAFPKGFAFIDSKQSRVYLVYGTLEYIDYISLFPTIQAIFDEGNILTISPEGYAANLVFSSPFLKSFQKNNEIEDSFSTISQELSSLFFSLHETSSFNQRENYSIHNQNENSSLKNNLSFLTNPFVLEEKEKIEKNIPIFKRTISFDLRGESPTCMCSRQKKRRIVFGINSGKCFIFDTNGKKTGEIDLKGRIPKKILITKSWGFIVVYCQKWLGLYSINGIEIDEKEINSEISLWETWTSKQGQDFLICSTEGGTISVFEVFKLNISEFVNFHEKIICMYPSKTLNGVLIVLHNGDIAFIPFSQLIN